MSCRGTMRSRRLQAAVPRLIDSICREINRRGLTSAQVKELYPTIKRENLWRMRQAWHAGETHNTGFGPDRLMAIAEALEIDTQPLLYPPQAEPMTLRTGSASSSTLMPILAS